MSYDPDEPDVLRAMLETVEPVDSFEVLSGLIVGDLKESAAREAPAGRRPLRLVVGDLSVPDVPDEVYDGLVLAAQRHGEGEGLLAVLRFGLWLVQADEETLPSPE